MHPVCRSAPSPCSPCLLRFHERLRKRWRFVEEFLRASRPRICAGDGLRNCARSRAERLDFGWGWGHSLDVADSIVRPATSGAWTQLASLPAVNTAYSFALAANDVDNSARLGFMFFDTAYEATLNGEGVLWAGEGSYNGSNAVALYELTASGSSYVWTPYQGRYTPQTYQFSELRYDSGSSYYTTLYTSFGGLISVIQNGGKGVYALTPAYTTQRAHSVRVRKSCPLPRSPRRPRSDSRSRRLRARASVT